MDLWQVLYQTHQPQLHFFMFFVLHVIELLTKVHLKPSFLKIGLLWSKYLARPDTGIPLWHKCQQIKATTCCCSPCHTEHLIVTSTPWDFLTHKTIIIVDIFSSKVILWHPLILSKTCFTHFTYKKKPLMACSMVSTIRLSHVNEGLVSDSKMPSFQRKQLECCRIYKIAFPIITPAVTDSRLTVIIYGEHQPGAASILIFLVTPQVFYAR